MHRRFSRVALAVLASLVLPADAGAQTRTAVVVPADAAVVVPPRGAAALPRPVASRPVGQHRPRLPPMEPARKEGGLDLGGAGTVAGVLLPAIAAAALTAVLSNGGGSGNHGAAGPARTR